VDLGLQRALFEQDRFPVLQQCVHLLKVECIAELMFEGPGKDVNLKSRF
jgi:hypothetical protein